MMYQSFLRAIVIGAGFTVGVLAATGVLAAVFRVISAIVAHLGTPLTAPAVL